MKGNENQMKLSDIIALAKAGYKPGDIKELLSIDESKQDDKRDIEKKEEKKEVPGKSEPAENEDPFAKLVDEENNKNKKE